jgi:hypothetical protein
VESGSPERNARLTALTGAVLLVLLAIEGFTLLSVRAMLSWHVFVGVLIVPVVALKLGSTGYRVFRYYTRRPDYVRAGPPQPLLRLLGPVVAVSTLALLGSGVALIALGPGAGHVLLLHRASFFVWLGAFGIHVLAHLARLWSSLGAELSGRDRLGGARMRFSLITAAVAIGAVAAFVVLPHDAAWLHWTRFDN